MKRNKLIFALIAPIASLGVISCGFGESSKASHSVKADVTNIVDIHDGDTFTTSDNRQIRLFGVDSAELSNNVDGEWIDTIGKELEWGIKARDFARSLILHKQVELKLQGASTYSRYVAKVIFGDHQEDLGLKLIKAGLARMGYISTKIGNTYYTSDISYYYLLKNAEAQAKASHIGIWGLTEDINTIYASKPHITN